VLDVRDVDVFIDASQILRRVTLEVGAREAICLVGRNGSGKTTTLRTIMGYRRPRAGAKAFHQAIQWSSKRGNLGGISQREFPELAEALRLWGKQ